MTLKKCFQDGSKERRSYGLGINCVYGGCSGRDRGERFLVNGRRRKMARYGWVKLQATPTIQPGTI